MKNNVYVMDKKHDNGTWKPCRMTNGEITASDNFYDAHRIMREEIDIWWNAFSKAEAKRNFRIAKYTRIQ